MVISSLKYELQRPLHGGKDSLAGPEGNNFIMEHQIIQQITQFQKMSWSPRRA